MFLLDFHLSDFHLSDFRNSLVAAMNCYKKTMPVLLVVVVAVPGVPSFQGRGVGLFFRTQSCILQKIATRLQLNSPYNPFAVRVVCWENVIIQSGASRIFKQPATIPPPGSQGMMPMPTRSQPNTSQNQPSLCHGSMGEAVYGIGKRGIGKRGIGLQPWKYVKIALAESIGWSRIFLPHWFTTLVLALVLGLVYGFGLWHCITALVSSIGFLTMVESIGF